MNDKEYRKNNERYKAGVNAGISYSVEYLMGHLRNFGLKDADRIIHDAIEFLIKEFNS
jgi:hypothetical protein